MILGDYLGSASITDPRIQSLNNDYFTKGYSSTDYNMKAVAYMLDTSAWSGFSGDKAEYAVGSPSIELFFKSYSEKYKVNYIAQAKSTGYQMSNNGGASWTLPAYDSILDINDSTYVSSKSFWISSPYYDSSEIINIYSNGRVGAYSYSSTTNGLRPIVCLKSDIQLEKNPDGSYTIVEPPKNNNIKPSDYGATVKGYTCTNSAAVNNWLLFYADT